MAALIISDDEWITTRLRQCLGRQGFECPPNHTVASELAIAFLGKTEADLIVVVLSPDPQRMTSVVQEIRCRTRAPILAVGPTTDARLVLCTLHSGARDYLDQEELETEMEGALRRCRNSRSLFRTGQVLFVYGPCGGTGASTLVVNLGVAMAREHGKALLVDLKAGQGDLSALLDLKPSFTLADLCQNISQLDRTMFQRSLVAHSSGAHLLAAPNTLADNAFLSEDALRQAMALGRNLFPYTLIDGDRSCHESLEPTLRLADMVLVPMRLDFTCLRNARRSLDVLGDLGVARERIRLVANRQGQPGEVPTSKAEQALGMKIFHHVPDDPRVMMQANNNGEPAILNNPSAKISRSLAQLGTALFTDKPA